MSNGQQDGVALISVLFIVAVLTLLSAQLFTQGRDNLERTQWLQTQAQAYQYAIGGEVMARQLLHQDYLAIQAEGDTYSPVPGPARHFLPDQGDIVLLMADLQGRININSLISDTYGASVKRYLNQNSARHSQIALLADWLDGDTRARPGGREDNDYLNEAPYYRAANRPMTHASELRLVSDYQGNSAGAESNQVTALPAPTPLNINTLHPDLAWLVHPQLSSAYLTNQQLFTPFSSVGEFMQADITAGLAVNPSRLTVTSHYYQATVHARFDDGQQPLTSRFYLDPATGEIELLDRELVTGDRLDFNDDIFDREAGDATDLTL